MGFLPVDDVHSPEGSISEHHPIPEETDRKTDEGFVPVMLSGKTKSITKNWSFDFSGSFAERKLRPVPA